MAEPLQRTPQGVIDYARKHEAMMADLKFADLSGAWQHFSAHLDELAKEGFKRGLPITAPNFTNNSRGHAELFALADAETACIDPFCAVPTLSLTCSISDVATRQTHALDPRGVAQRAEAHLRTAGAIDAVQFQLGCEFFVFDNVQYDEKPNGAFYSVDSEEGLWNSGRDEVPNLGYKWGAKGRPLPAAPSDTQQDLRTEMCLAMEQLSLSVLRHQHGTSGAGHARIEIGASSLLKATDAVMLLRYVVKNVARRHGKTATFMPQPLGLAAGSHLLARLALLGKGKSVLAGGKGERFSKTALHFAGGLQKHSRALAAFCRPTTNSYRHAGVSAGATRNFDPADARHNDGWIEARFVDSSANPYLCLPALLLAGLDGVAHRLEPEESSEGGNAGEELPSTLSEAVDALEQDHEFLLNGNVFSRDLLETWVQRKREEHRAVEQRPHPHEFFLYYDV
jgi:glutamine synthetase